jgi:4-amino-4-deoxy-L-arabinose transferase-like glycosyltransferase
MLQGVPPYQLAFNIKLPGTYTVYALIMALFGQNQSGIHLGFLFVNLGNLALLYFLARRFLDEAGVLVCCAAYVLLSLSSAVLGLQGHATNLVIINALGGLLLLLRAREKNQPGLMFLSGLLFGLSFLCKQPGLFFTVLAVALLARDGWAAGMGQ